MIFGKTREEKDKELESGVRRFACMPTIMNDGRVVWLRYYWLVAWSSRGHDGAPKIRSRSVMGELASEAMPTLAEARRVAGWD